MAHFLKLPRIHPAGREKYLPRVDCAWCGTRMREGVLPISHGMCDGCRVAFEEGRLRDVTKEGI